MALRNFANLVRATEVFKARTFAQLPASPRTGEVAYISDAGQNTVGSAVTSGGSTLKVLAWYNGTQWTCFGK